MRSVWGERGLRRTVGRIVQKCCSHAAGPRSLLRVACTMSACARARQLEETASPSEMKHSSSPLSLMKLKCASLHTRSKVKQRSYSGAHCTTARTFRERRADLALVIHHPRRFKRGHQPRAGGAARAARTSTAGSGRPAFRSRGRRDQHATARSAWQHIVALATWRHRVAALHERVLLYALEATVACRPQKARQAGSPASPQSSWCFCHLARSREIESPTLLSSGG